MKSLPLRGLLSLILTLATGHMALAADSEADPGARLRVYLEQVQTLTADFDQTVFDPEGGETQRASGHVWLHRPARFRWDYLEPYRQRIVSDGRTLWIYDEDLEQVTVRTFDATIARTPALALSSDRPLEDAYAIAAAERREGLDWLHLTPKAGDNEYAQIRLGFEGEELRAMELLDGFEQTTRLNFRAIVHNPVLDPIRFRFDPPPGVDVIEER